MQSNNQTSSGLSRRLRASAIQTIDDTDPAIRYVGQWKTLYLENAFHQTAHSTMAAGASLEYNFTGSSISVYGHVDVTDSGHTSVSTYTLDNLPSTPFTAQQPTGSNPLNNVLFFNKSNLTPGDHTLVVRRASTDGATYVFDYIQLQSDDNATSSESITPSSTEPPTSSSSTDTGSHNATATSSPNAANQNTNGTKDVIVGVVSGIAVLLLITLLTIFLLARRRRRNGGKPVNSASPAESVDSPNAREPLMSFRSVIPVLRNAAPQENGATHSANTVPCTDQVHPQVTDTTVTCPTDSTTRDSVLIIGNGDAAGAPNSQHPTSSRMQAREMDGGITLAGGPFDAASEEPGLLPPEYGSILRHQLQFAE